MPDADDHPVERWGKRLIGLVLGLVLGLVGGLVLALATSSFGDGLLAFVVRGGLAGALFGFFFPTPFLFVGSVLLSLFSDLS